ncbi:protein midgut expression 1 [Drosophila kikkawai]|uniref:Protein midgut expression 1 n=1 Tax=Drosophila kikkawai TaxID=30033 RepID=A0A6P4IHP6_DROKI|nr:protein midgut expression 1 [Drosophila kikkawai]
MCLRLLGSCLCCCCQLGLKLLCLLVFSVFGVLLIAALVVYFCFFHNKSEKTTTLDDTSTLKMETPKLFKVLLHRLVDRI